MLLETPPFFRRRREHGRAIGSSCFFVDSSGSGGERMLRADLVREMVARAQRGEGAKRIARELGVDRKTVKRWLRLGAWKPRRHQPRPRPIDGFVKFGQGDLPTISATRQC